MKSMQIDIFPVVIAALVNMVIGFFWYSKWFFGPLWKKKSKAKEADVSPQTLFFGFIVSLFIAYFLAFFISYTSVTSITDGMFVGFLLWLGFVATTQVGSIIWTNTPLLLFFIDSGYKLFAILVMSGIISA